MLRNIALWAKGSHQNLTLLTSRLATQSVPLLRGLATDAAGPSQKISPYFLYVPSVLCGFLAYWQYERKQWKEDLLERRRRTLQGTTADLFSQQAPQPDQKVSLAGTFLHDRSLFVGPRPRSINGTPELGFLLITPLLSKDGRAVALVNRGWVPSSWRDHPPPDSPADGSSAQVTGVLQPDEQPSVFMPKNRPEEDEFHSIDRVALAGACGLPSDTPLVQVVNTDPAASPPPEPSGHGMGGGARAVKSALGGPPPTFPLEKHQDELLRFTVMPQDHVGYAATWLLLCVGLAGFARHVTVAKTRAVSKFVDNRAAWEARRSG